VNHKKKKKVSPVVKFSGKGNIQNLFGKKKTPDCEGGQQKKQIENEKRIPYMKSPFGGEKFWGGAKIEKQDELVPVYSGGKKRDGKKSIQLPRPNVGRKPRHRGFFEKKEERANKLI